MDNGFTREELEEMGEDLALLWIAQDALEEFAERNADTLPPVSDYDWAVAVSALNVLNPLVEMHEDAYADYHGTIVGHETGETTHPSTTEVMDLLIARREGR